MASSIQASRIAVVDLGTNSTRLLVAEVRDGQVVELERRTDVTRLGQRVDATGRLADAAMARVEETLVDYRQVMDDLEARRTVAIATSAVRDAENGEAFRARLRERFGLEARTISGEEEARLTFLGATAGLGATRGLAGAEGGVDQGGVPAGPDTQAGATRVDDDPAPDRRALVVDIGGGSTELVIGIPGAEPEFHLSAELGSVRQTERHIVDDPPPPEQVAELSRDAQRIIEAGVPGKRREVATSGIAVAGTVTSLAAIDQCLAPYDPERVHGYELLLGACERMLAMLAALPLAERREVTGLHPDRAPTIVAGAVILVEAMRAFELESMTVSEADLLHGAALSAAAGGAP